MQRCKKRQKQSVDGLAVTGTVATMAGWLASSCVCFNHHLVIYSDLGKSYDSEHL